MSYPQFDRFTAPEGFLKITALGSDLLRVETGLLLHWASPYIHMLVRKRPSSTQLWNRPAVLEPKQQNRPQPQQLTDSSLASRLCESSPEQWLCIGGTSVFISATSTYIFQFVMWGSKPVPLIKGRFMRLSSVMHRFRFERKQAGFYLPESGKGPSTICSTLCFKSLSFNKAWRILTL